MSNPVNHLPTLKPSVFEHLFKFLNPSTAGIVCDLFDLSPTHGHGQVSDRACQPFHSCSQCSMGWECAEIHLFTHVHSLGILCSALTVEQSVELQCRKEQIKHLNLVSEAYNVDQQTCRSLEEFMEDNDTLESLAVRVKASKEESLFGLHEVEEGGASEQLTLSGVMEHFATMGASVTLSVRLMGRPHRDVCCRLFSFPEHEPFCRYLTHLSVPQHCFGESATPETNSHRTELPSTVFMAGLPVLQHLEVNGHSLSGQLLQALAQRTAHHSASLPLRTLTIHMDRDCPGAPNSLPDVSEEAWRELVEAFPGLQVACDIKGLSGDGLLLVIKPEAPLVSLKVTENYWSGQDDVIYTCWHFRRTLRLFRCSTLIGCDGGDFKFLLTGSFFMTRRLTCTEGIVKVITIM